MQLIMLPETFAITKLPATDPLPDWVPTEGFTSITRTSDELSIVCEQNALPSGINAEKDWRAFKVPGPLDFSLTGILSMIAAPLANQKISIFAISTFDTDYVLIKQHTLGEAVKALQAAGIEIL